MDRLVPLLSDLHSSSSMGLAQKRRRLSSDAREYKFGALIRGLSIDELAKPEILSGLKSILHERGGLLIMRGLTGLSSQQLVDFTAAFGEVENNLPTTVTPMHVPGAIGGVVMRIGNTREASGGLTASFVRYAPAQEAAPGEPGFLESVQFNTHTRTPVWHQDQVFFQKPPAGSVLYCITAPPEGADTCFADATAALEALPADRRERVEQLEAVCSIAHHDARVHQTTPSFPLLNEEQRRANPPVIVPLALKHPVTGRKALYGVNLGTWYVRQIGGPPPTEKELQDAEGEKAMQHPSVERELLSLLPHATAPSFTVRWRWAEGDIVVWDNRSTFHCGTKFDDAKYTRELWRTTYHDKDHNFARRLVVPT
mmetsp:Transcript_80740/g.224756  ORF Transcript_80740/g.224756 Transcript_80740/m.224756 type:complete len:369 (+) Transcript_80740:146-1252(+)|eukprot:CAMPEP_0117518548 /NCGR_PEP_ID=MMETSP0784-20121206/32188_1 /TAXON_ID=39447 /ORGANISM="" /LENGTH=368 /DNA_ID=CAMNT_0005314471 /DNA_START=136 /DNA_END=1242 /DNA_ORIENTATION=+